MPIGLARRGGSGAAPLPTVEPALADAERKGFRLAVIGRTCALVAIAVFYLAALSYPSNIYVAGLTLAISAVGLAPLGLAGSRYERIGRYALFAFDAAAISAMLALAPLSSGGDVPQNLVFFSSRTEYYYVIVAVSVLALSPALVLWTGLCAVIGLAGATAWIMARHGARRQPRRPAAVAFARRLFRRRAQSRLPRRRLPRERGRGACAGDVHRGARRPPRPQHGPGACRRRGRAHPHPAASSAAMCRRRWPSSSSMPGNLRRSSARRASSSPISKASRGCRNPCRPPQ